MAYTASWFSVDVLLHRERRVQFGSMGRHCRACGLFRPLNFIFAFASSDASFLAHSTLDPYTDGQSNREKRRPLLLVPFTWFSCMLFSASAAIIFQPCHSQEKTGFVRRTKPPGPCGAGLSSKPQLWLSVAVAGRHLQSRRTTALLSPITALWHLSSPFTICTPELACCSCVSTPHDPLG